MEAGEKHLDLQRSTIEDGRVFGPTHLLLGILVRCGLGVLVGEDGVKVWRGMVGEARL
jgi:hypothetical protein